MSEHIKCGIPAAYRYTWAGKNEGYACIRHAHQIGAVAQAVGYDLQFLRLTEDEVQEFTCQNEEPSDE